MTMKSVGLKGLMAVVLMALSSVLGYAYGVRTVLREALASGHAVEEVDEKGLLHFSWRPCPNCVPSSHSRYHHYSTHVRDMPGEDR